MTRTQDAALHNLMEINNCTSLGDTPSSPSVEVSSPSPPSSSRVSWWNARHATSTCNRKHNIYVHRQLSSDRFIISLLVLQFQISHPSRKMGFVSNDNLMWNLSPLMNVMSCNMTTCSLVVIHCVKRKFCLQPQCTKSEILLAVNIEVTVLWYKTASSLFVSVYQTDWYHI